LKVAGTPTNDTKTAVKTETENREMEVGDVRETNKNDSIEKCESEEEGEGDSSERESVHSSVYAGELHAETLSAMEAATQDRVDSYEASKASVSVADTTPNPNPVLDDAEAAASGETSESVAGSSVADPNSDPVLDNAKAAGDGAGTLVGAFEKEGEDKEEGEEKAKHTRPKHRRSSVGKHNKKK